MKKKTRKTTVNRIDEWLTEDGLTRLRGLARRGYTNKQIAEDFIGIKNSSLSRWCKDYEQIKTALKLGRQPLLDNIEEAFYNKCFPHDVEDLVTEVTEFADGTKQKKIKKVKRHVEADTGAQIFAMKNLDPERWQDRREMVVESNIDKETINAVETMINESKRND